jgi:hypothetical protein
MVQSEAYIATVLFTARLAIPPAAYKSTESQAMSKQYSTEHRQAYHSTSCPGRGAAQTG